MIAIFRSRSLGNMTSGGGGKRRALYGPWPSLPAKRAKKGPAFRRGHILPKQSLGGGGLEVHYRCIPLTRDWIRAADRIQERDVVRGFGIVIARFAAEDDRIRAGLEQGAIDVIAGRVARGLDGRDGIVGSVDVIGRRVAAEHVDDVRDVEVDLVVGCAVVD